MGIEYEKFVQTLMQVILNSEAEGRQKNIEVEHNKKLIDRYGIERQFDIYWEYEQAGFVYKTIIECKDYNSAVGIEKIDALKGKMDDFPGIRGIIATKIGYQSGAETKALKNNIDIICVREQNDTDWVGMDGTPLIKKVILKFTALLPPRVTEFNTFVDKCWIEENTNIDITKPLMFCALNNEIFIEDNFSGEKYSLYDWEQNLLKPEDKNYNEDITVTKKFEDAYLINQSTGQRIKLKGFKAVYHIPVPYETTSEIDATNMLLGVVEYLSKGYKKMVTCEGVVLDRELPKN